jgi:DNA replication protein
VTPEEIKPFSGFQNSDLDPVRLPQAFFSDLLLHINDLHELQLLLYMFWHLEQDQDRFHYFRLQDFTSDLTLVEMIGGEDILQKSLNGLLALGAVLKADLPWMEETYYFINGPQGRSAVEAIEAGNWQETGRSRQPAQMTPEPMNIFKLYEANIGPITPMIADVLKADEAEYPADWIEEAIRIAVTKNVRNWKYVQAILSRWQKEGRGNEQYRRDNSQDPENEWKKWLKYD